MSDETQIIEKPLKTEGADKALNIQKVLKRLIECLSQETLALKSNNRALAIKMAEEKARLTHDYREIQNNFQKDPEAFQKLDKGVQAHLKSLIAEFETILTDNVQAIQSGRNAVNRLIDRILTRARDMATTHTTYNADGQVNTHKASRSATTPIQISEKF